MAMRSCRIQTGGGAMPHLSRTAEGKAAAFTCANGRFNTTETPFSIFKNFGFQSGVDKDKFEGISYSLSENGLPVLNDFVNTLAQGE